MKFSYIRPTKLHPEAEQCEALIGERFDQEYVDEKPRRGDAEWYFRDKVIHACRHGSNDEIWVSHVGVIADSVSVALEKLAEIARRGAVLVVASTGKRYSWHPDAADAMDLAREMEREARREVARIGGEATRRNAEARRQRAARKTAEAKRLWLDTSLETADVVERTGLKREALYRLFGARGLEPFVGAKKGHSP